MLGTGHHRQHGLLLVSGSGIRLCHVESASLVDLTPTVLHILDLPLPDDLDGRILSELFKPGSLWAQREPRFMSSRERTPSEFTYTEAEEQAISDHLKGLGYF